MLPRIILIIINMFCVCLVYSKEYTQNDYQSVKQNALTNGYNITKALPKNHVTNGSVDYRDQIQNALNKHRIVILPNFPVLINDKGLTVSSNSVIVFQAKSKLILKTSNKPKYEIVRIHNVENIFVFDANIEGDKFRHVGSSGEFGNGISLRNSKNIKIIRGNITKCWGDGIIVGSFNNKPCSSIEINNVTLDNNRRNGISITCVDGLKINGLIAKNTSGTLPMSGICIEPNNNNEIVNNISIKNSFTENNERCGIQIGLGKLPGIKRHSANITVENYSDVNSGIGIYLGSYRDSYKNSNKIGGDIILKNIKLSNNKETIKTGYNFKHGPLISIENFTIDTKISSQKKDKIINRLKGSSYAKSVVLKP